MAEDNEARAINELSQRIHERDKKEKEKSKGKIYHGNNMSLTEEEKLKLLPDLRAKSRMKYLDRREK